MVYSNRALLKSSYQKMSHFCYASKAKIISLIKDKAIIAEDHSRQNILMFAFCDFITTRSQVMLAF